MACDCPCATPTSARTGGEKVAALADPNRSPPGRRSESNALGPSRVSHARLSRGTCIGAWVDQSPLDRIAARDVDAVLTGHAILCGAIGAGTELASRAP